MKFLNNPKLFQTFNVDGVVQLFSAFCKSPFLTRILPRFLMSFALSNSKDLDAVVLPTLTALLKVLELLPDEAALLHIEFLKPYAAQCDDEHVIYKYNDLETLKSLCIKNASLPSATPTKTDSKFSIVNEVVDYQKIPILPTPEELSGKIQSFLRKNRTSAPYKEDELLLFLDTHFRLLREEYVGVRLKPFILTPANRAFAKA